MGKGLSYIGPLLVYCTFFAADQFDVAAAVDEVVTNFTDKLLLLEACSPLLAANKALIWSKRVSPLHPLRWEEELKCHPDRQFADYVIRGVREGFRLGYDYHHHCISSSSNMKSADVHKSIVDKYIFGECEKGRVVGPLDRREFPDVQVSPFGVIPKKSPGEWRLIFDLSSPRGKSVNDGINPDLCSLSYLTIDRLVEQMVKAGRGALMAKFDLKSAYRNVPVHPDDRWLLGMMWNGQLFVDTVLPFGLRSAPIIFTAVADALEFVVKQRDICWIGHYLDDFVLIGPQGSLKCKHSLECALELCDKLGLPIAVSKTEGPATLLEILGIEFDSVSMVVRLPQRKLAKLRELVELWRKKKCCTKRDLQSLAGHLSHACKVVRPGKRFLRGIFGLLSLFKKKSHVIRLNGAFRADLEWWHVFAESWNGVSMMQQTAEGSHDVHLWSDASGSWGCGAWWDNNWFQLKWSFS